MYLDTFRTATTSDAQSIAKLVNWAYRPEPGAIGWTHESALVSGNRINATQVMAVMARPCSVILLGLKDSEIVACVHAEKDGGNSQIGMLAVHPSLQGVGIGKQMLAHAESHAMEIFGAEKFTMLVVCGRSELVAYYLRRGYQKTDTILNYPVAANVGVPKDPNLKIEVLEKWAKVDA